MHRSLSNFVFFFSHFRSDDSRYYKRWYGLFTFTYTVYDIFRLLISVWPNNFIVVVVLLFYVHGKHLRSCRAVNYPNHTFPGQAQTS